MKPGFIELGTLLHEITGIGPAQIRTVMKKLTPATLQNVSRNLLK